MPPWDKNVATSTGAGKKAFGKQFVFALERKKVDCGRLKI